MELCKLRTYSLTLLAAFSALPAFALSNYRAVYDISVRGVPAGTVRHEAFFTNVTYRVDTVANPSVAARMLGFGEIRESVKGLLQGNTVQPQHYQRDIAGDQKYHLDYQFVPAKHQVSIEKADNRKTVSYHAELHPLDTLSMVVQSLKDIENSRMPSEYTLVMEDSIQSYQVQKQPDQTWETREGHSFKVHVYRQINGNKQTVVYYADNPLRLVRLEQLRKGEKRFSMTLTDFKSLK